MKSLLIALCFLSGAAGAQTHVDGHWRKDGTYVQPHYRSTPDQRRDNNYGSQGNYNPYTGQQGTRNPYSYEYSN